MNLKKVATAAVAGVMMAALPATGAMASTIRASQALPAKVSADQADRLGAPVGEQNEQLFDGGFLLPAIIVIALGVGLYFVLDDGNSSDSPNT